MRLVLPQQHQKCLLEFATACWTASACNPAIDVSSQCQDQSVESTETASDRSTSTQSRYAVFDVSSIVLRSKACAVSQWREGAFYRPRELKLTKEVGECHWMQAVVLHCVLIDTVEHSDSRSIACTEVKRSLKTQSDPRECTICKGLDGLLSN